MTYYCIQMINNSQFAHFLKSYKKAYFRCKILTKKFGINVYLLDVYGQTLLRILFIKLGAPGTIRSQLLESEK
jgi:hypothetical protein